LWAAIVQVEIGQRHRACRRTLELRRTPHLECFVRALVIEVVDELVEAGVLLQAVRAGGFRIKNYQSGYVLR
jgi:hypothetical protein